MAVIDGELSLGMVGRALWRNKRLIIGPMLIMTAVAFVGVNLVTPRYKSEARVLVEGRENIFLRPEAEKAMIDRRRGRSGDGDEPGPARAVARSRARGDQRAQPDRSAGVQRRAARVLAADDFADHRHPQGSDVDGARRARARRLLRPAQRLCDREVARDRHRIPVGRSRSGCPHRQHDRREVPDVPAGDEAGSGALGQPVAVRRARKAARQGVGGRSQGRGLPRQVQPVRRQQQHQPGRPAAHRIEQPGFRRPRAKGRCRSRAHA